MIFLTVAEVIFTPQSRVTSVPTSPRKTLRFVLFGLAT
jgi:hypothetical protein